MNENPDNGGAIIASRRELGLSVLPDELRRNLQELDTAALALTNLLKFTTPLRAMIANDDQGKYGAAIDQLPLALQNVARQHIADAISPDGLPTLMQKIEGLTGEMRRLNEYLAVQNQTLHLQVGGLEASLFGVTKIKTS